MTITRREILRKMSLLGAVPLLPSLQACAGSEEQDEFPSYAWDGPLGPETMFEHGVASGDPLPDSVILWTRVSVDDGGPAEVFVEVAKDAEFSELVAAGYEEASADRDHTLKLDVGGLDPATTYYFRFFCEGRESSVGRTRTAPSGATDRLRFGVCSCSNYAYGYFHAYKHAAQQDDLDAVLHLGDYIYEYGDGQYGDVRTLEPAGEILTLEDYRARYAINRRDSDLQEVHRQHPMIAVWDDHETADNSYKDGAGNHTEGAEGSWVDRLAAASKAYAEWMPYREGVEGEIYRRLSFGDLVDLFMLDTRIHGRDAPAAGLGDVDTIDDESRTLLGDDQEAWLLDGLSNSTATWRLLGQQVVMTQMLAGTSPLNVDQWDGYAPARTRLLSHIQDQGIDNVVVLTGDIHSSWANDVPINIADYDEDTRAGSVVVEFVTPGVSSPGASILESVSSSNPNIRFLNGTENGYMIIDITASRVQADWYRCAPEDVATTEGEVAYRNSYAVEAGSPAVYEAEGPAARKVTAPPLAP